MCSLLGHKQNQSLCLLAPSSVPSMVLHMFEHISAKHVSTLTKLARFASLVKKSLLKHIQVSFSFHFYNFYAWCVNSWQHHHILWRGQPVPPMQQKGVFWWVLSHNTWVKRCKAAKQLLHSLMCVFVFVAEKVTSLGKDWHRPCLRCERCSKTLSAGSHAEVRKRGVWGKE